MDRSVMYQATVEVDLSQIGTIVVGESSPVSFTEMVLSVTAHELGHVLGLLNIGVPPFQSCTNITSIMYAEAIDQARCGHVAPTSTCDIAGVDAFYTGWPVGDYYECSTSSCP